KLLKEIANILRNSVPKDATIFRWGGDEFVVLLENIEHRELDRICGVIAKNTLEFESSTPVKPSISIGHAIKETAEESLYRTLIRAEDMMYENKLLEKSSWRSVIVSSLESSLYEKSYETEEHALRVADYSKLIAEALNLHQNEITSVIVLSKLHDIGKIAIDDSILLKPGKLDKFEWAMIKKHPETGYRIASSLNELAHIADGILSHHEHYDGKGYPRGLKGEDIPLHARIVSIADAFDVMTSERAYKQTLSIEEAISELISCRGTQFDPNLVDIFIDIIRKK
ncbi:MAG: HD domain-containing protein, partial [Firmicutes bacterium]|nr:HD domain-containing protein [Bacillota bacterium]